MDTFLQFFLLLNVFLIGALVMFAAQHAYVHFRPPHHEEKKPQPPTPQLPPEIKERLLQKSEIHFQAVLDHAANDLQKDLKVTSAQILKQLDKLGGEVVAAEMRRYQTDLEELRQQTQTMLTTAQAGVESHQADLTTKLEQHHAEMEAKLSEEIAAEKQRLIEQIDTKIADTVTSFIIETMQHNVDLGAQGAYLTSMLEEHKAELAKGISDET
jgi:F0F1-type ATP synthase membrane subunit b/b'